VVIAASRFSRCCLGARDSLLLRKTFSSRLGASIYHQRERRKEGPAGQQVVQPKAESWTPDAEPSSLIIGQELWRNQEKAPPVRVAPAAKAGSLLPDAEPSSTSIDSKLGEVKGNAGGRSFAPAERRPDAIQCKKQARGDRAEPPPSGRSRPEGER